MSNTSKKETTRIYKHFTVELSSCTKLGFCEGRGDVGIHATSSKEACAKAVKLFAEIASGLCSINFCEADGTRAGTVNLYASHGKTIAAVNNVATQYAYA